MTAPARELTPPAVEGALAAPAVVVAAVVPPAGWYSRLCTVLARISLGIAIFLLLAVIACVQWQVIGRYVLNDTPTWAETLALLLVLYLTSLSVAVGVRDAGHIGLESFLVLLPERFRVKLEIVIHALVAVFGVIMAKDGWRWTTLKWSEKMPMLGVSEGMKFLPLVLAGVLIVLFCVEHIIALARGKVVEATWN